MDAKNIILKLKSTQYKKLEAISIKSDLRKLPAIDREIVLNRLKEEKSKSDNSDIIDVINDIIDEFNPKK